MWTHDGKELLLLKTNRGSYIVDNTGGNVTFEMQIVTLGFVSECPCPFAHTDRLMDTSTPYRRGKVFLGAGLFKDHAERVTGVCWYYVRAGRFTEIRGIG